MDYGPDYDLLLRREVPSWLYAHLPREADPPGVTEIRARLAASGLPVVEAGPTLPDEDPDLPGARFTATVRLRFEGDDADTTMHVWIRPSEPLGGMEVRLGYLTVDEAREADASRFALGVSTTFGPQALRDFHRQIRVIAAVAPEAVVMVDAASLRPRPMQWALDAAATRVPPNPIHLYAVHSVFDDRGPRGRTWLHTHGLLRCGSIELEMLDVPTEDAGSLAVLLNAVAAVFVENGFPLPGDRFHAGQDLELCWLPPTEALRMVRRGIPGRGEDRDDAHAGPSGVLLVPLGRGLLGDRYENPAVYTKILRDNPLLYVTNMETERRALLARERLPSFRTRLARHGGGGGDWKFLVKLGYPVDGAQEPGEREHLWFEVHAMDADSVDATLLNAPYSVSRLREGMRGRHLLELLSDWSIHAPEGEYGPADVQELDRELLH